MTYHILPNKAANNWKVQKSGSDRACRYFDTKQQAIDYAKEVSKNQGSNFRIHNRNGQIS